MSNDTYLGLTISVSISCLIVTLFILFGEPVEIDMKPFTNAVVKPMFEQISYYLDNPFEMLKNPIFYLVSILILFPMVRTAGLFDFIFEQLEKRNKKTVTIDGSES